MSDNEKTVSVDLPSEVAKNEAIYLCFYHLDMAACYFEGTPKLPALLTTFDEQNPDLDATGVRAKRNFLEALDAEYATEDAIDESLKGEDE